MGSKKPTDISAVVALENPIDVTLNFSEMPSFLTKSQEIRRSLLTGRHTKRHDLRPANVVLSAMRDFDSDGGVFEYVDFKDSFVERATFQKCTFDFGAIINCDFEDVEFEGCSFHNLSITGSMFSRVVFRNCSLDHMVIELCKFFDCQFIDCTTSNKLFDFCLFCGSTFAGTNLQIQTLIGNFGLSKDDVSGVAIRDKSADEEFRLLNLEEIAASPVATPIEAFKLSYFIDREGTLAGSEAFEATFTLDSWIGTAKIPLTFTNLLSLYMEFLLALYDNADIVVFPILKLHSLTGALVDEVSIPAGAMTPVYGVHMTLSRVAETYLDAVISSVRRAETTASILVSGPLDPTFYLTNFPFIFQREGIAIVGIKRHNSPNEMLLSWDTVTSMVPFIALFMASRFKLEIASYDHALARLVDRKSDIKSSTGKNLIPVRSLFEVNLGFDREDSHLFGLKVKSIFPGNMLVELGLQLSIKQVLASRLLLLKILNAGERKE